MNNKREEEIPLVNIERSPILLLVSATLAALFIFLTYKTVFGKEAHEVEPLGFFLFVPTAVFSFQTLWYLLNPFAIVYEDKLEIKQSLFQNKFWFFVDIQKVDDLKDGILRITYNDSEIEKINLIGIKPSHKGLLREALNKQVAISLTKRLY